MCSVDLLFEYCTEYVNVWNFASEPSSLFVGCPCAVFNSNFLCAACDKHWEQHETFFETEDMRRREGLPVGMYELLDNII